MMACRRDSRALIAAGCSSRADAFAVTEPGSAVPGLTTKNLAEIREWLGFPIGAAGYTVSSHDVLKAIEVLRRAGYDVSSLKPPQG